MNMEYQQVLIETYKSIGEASSTKIRARPRPGQGLSVDMKVECSKKMREAHPVGTIFRVTAKVTSREGGTPFLYTSDKWAYEVVSEKA